MVLGSRDSAARHLATASNPRRALMRGAVDYRIARRLVREPQRAPLTPRKPSSTHHE
jgi:hypothetical protein